MSSKIQTVKFHMIFGAMVAILDLYLQTIQTA